MSDVIDLYSLGAAQVFRVGDPLYFRMRPDGSLRSETWRDRWASALAEAFWPSPRFVVTSVDRDAGVITVGRR